MKLRIVLALLALASPAFVDGAFVDGAAPNIGSALAQTLPTPNLGTGTKLNGATLTTTATKGQGTSVADPGSGNLESLLPVQTVTGASRTFTASDLYKETRRSSSGAAMTDTFPGTSTSGLANGTTIQLNNVDTTANLTLSAGSGTTLNGNASVVIAAQRSTKWVYDAPNTMWRSTMNSLSGVIGPSSAVSGNAATFNGTSGVLVQDSGKALPSGTVVGTSDTQTLTNKTISGASNSLTVRLANDVSGTLPVGNGGTGDTGTGWTAYTPTVSTVGTSGGTITFGAVSGRYKQIGKTVFCQIQVNVTSSSISGGGVVTATLPVNFNTNYNWFGTGQEIGTTGYGLTGQLQSASQSIWIRKYDATFPAPANGTALLMTFVYEAA